MKLSVVKLCSTAALCIALAGCHSTDTPQSLADLSPIDQACMAHSDSCGGFSLDSSGAPVVSIKPLANNSHNALLKELQAHPQVSIHEAHASLDELNDARIRIVELNDASINGFGINIEANALEITVSAAGLSSEAQLVVNELIAQGTPMLLTPYSGETTALGG